MSGVPTIYKIPLIDGIPLNALPRFRVLPNGKEIDYLYPAPADLQKYLDLMDVTLTQIHEALKLNPRSLKTLRLLARFYQLGIVGHPFVRVNNSVLMALVNTVLIRMGLVPISHGKLDYEVRILSSDLATKVFIEHVSAAQLR